MNDIKVKLIKNSSPVVEPDIVVPNTGLFTMLEEDGTVVQENHQNTVAGWAVILLAVLVGLLIMKVYRGNHKIFAKRDNMYWQKDFRIGSRATSMIGLFLVAGILFISGIVLMQQRFDGDGESMAASDTLTIIASDIEIEAEVAKKDQVIVKPQIVSVGEATRAGYVLSVHTDNADLVNNEPGSKSKIAGLETSAYKRVSLSPNSWGIATIQPMSDVDEVWLGMGTSEATSNILKISRDATPVNDSTTIYYGVNVNDTLDAGEYSGKIIYTVVANPVTPDPEPEPKEYTVRYNANNGTGNTATQEATVGEPITLRANTFTYENHNFLGWDTNANGSYVVFHNEDMISDGLATTAGATIDLYAVWEENPCKTIDDLNYMQDFATLSDWDKTCVIRSMEENTKYSLFDNRQIVVFEIAKLKDDNVWMVSDLKLYSDQYEKGIKSDLSSSDTNILQSVSMATVAEWDYGTIVYNIDTPTPSFTNGQLANWLEVGADSLDVGHFNYCASSAGKICVDSNSGNASEDICPAGWRLPTGGDSGEFKKLYDALGSYEVMMDSVENGGAGFALTGFTLTGVDVSERRATKITGIGETGYYWSSSNANETDMYILSLTDSSADPIATGSRDSLYAIRCILK